jgi:hypothetical protein
VYWRDTVAFTGHGNQQFFGVFGGVYANATDDAQLLARVCMWVNKFPEMRASHTGAPKQRTRAASLAFSASRPARIQSGLDMQWYRFQRFPGVVSP